MKFLPSNLGARVKEYGRENVEEMNAFVTAQMYALKGVVETEGIECESELRRSFDVWLDEEDAKVGEMEWREQVKTGLKGIKEVEFIPGRVAERVSFILHPHQRD